MKNPFYPHDAAPALSDIFIDDYDSLKEAPIEKRLLDFWQLSSPEGASDEVSQAFEDALKLAQTIEFIPDKGLLDRSNNGSLRGIKEATMTMASGELTLRQKDLIDDTGDEGFACYCEKDKPTLDQVMRYTVSLMQIAPSALEYLRTYWGCAFKDSSISPNEDERQTHQQSRNWFKENQKVLSTIVSGPLTALVYTELCQEWGYNIVNFGFDDTLNFVLEHAMEHVRSLPFDDEVREVLQQNIIAMVQEKRSKIEGEVADSVKRLINSYAENYVLEVDEVGSGHKGAIEMITHALEHQVISEQLDATRANEALAKLQKMQPFVEDMRKYCREDITLDPPKAPRPKTSRDIHNDRSLSADEKAKLYKQAQQYEDMQGYDSEQYFLDLDKYFLDLDKYLSENEYGRKRLAQEVRYVIDPNQLADELVDRSGFSGATLRALDILQNRDETVRLLGLEEEAEALRSARNRIPGESKRAGYVVNELLKDAGVADERRQELLRIHAAIYYNYLLFERRPDGELETEKDIIEYVDEAFEDIEYVVDILKLSGLDYGLTGDDICDAAIYTRQLHLSSREYRS